MNKFLAGGLAAAALAVSAPAMADEYATRAAYKAPPVVVYDWTGFYYGVSLGWISQNVDGNFICGIAGQLSNCTTFSRFDHHSTDGDLSWFDLHGGFQKQWGAIVVGIEFAYASQVFDHFNYTDGPSGGCLASAVIGPGFGLRCESKLHSVWTLGGRLGYAWDKWLFYVTGGWASGEIETAVRVIPTSTFADSTANRHDGWYAGVGVEYLFNRAGLVDFIAGLEYQHMEFDTLRHNNAADGATHLTGSSRDMSAEADIIRFRLTVKVNPWAGTAVKAAY